MPTPPNKENGGAAANATSTAASGGARAAAKATTMPRSLASMRQDPFANVFKLCGLDQMRDVTTEGDVATIVDRSLGRKVLNVNGNVPAANYFRLPKIGKPPLGLRGRFAYVQARLDPERFYAIHLDILCVGSGDGPGKHDTGFREGAKTIRLSLSNLYKKKGDNKPYDALGGTAVNLTHEPAMRGWVILCFDVPQLLRAATTKAGKAAAKRDGGTGKKSAATAPAFDAIKSIQIGGAIAARNIFTSDFLYTAEDLPTEMHLSSKPDVAHEFVWVGDVAPKGDYAPHAAKRDGGGGGAAAAYEDPEDAALGAMRREGVPFAGGVDDMIDAKMTETDAKPLPPPPPPEPPVEPAPPPVGGPGAPTSTSTSTRVGPPPAAAGKPRGLANAPGAVADRDDAGYFGAGGAGGLSLHGRAREFAGAAGDVDAVTGMPPLTAKGDAPASPPAGAVLTPALKLERVIGLSGEHAGAVCWAPEGSSVAYPCGGVVVVSDALTGKQSHLFGHTEDVHLLTFSKDGRYLATGQRGRHPTVRLWDFETMNCVATMQAHASGLSSVDVSPDGRALVAAGMDTQGRQLIAVWDISKTPHGGAAPMVLRHRTDYHVNCVRFSPFEEDHLVTCGKNSIRAYRLRKGQLRGCSVSLGDLKLSKMMSGEAAAATDKTQKKKRPVDERLLNDFTTLAFEIGYGVTDLDAKRLYVATATGAVVQVNYGKRELECVYQLHDGAINALAINEGFAVTASDDRFLRVWPTDFSDFFLEAEHEAPVTSACVSSDGLQIVAATSTGSMGTLDVPTHAYRTLSRSHNASVTGVACDPVNDECATTSEDGTVRVWDVVTGEQLYEFDAPGESARCVAYRPARGGDSSGSKTLGNRALACGFTNGLSRVFDVANTSLLAEHRQHKGAVVDVTFTPDGSRMVTAGSEGNVCVYDAEGGYLPVKYLATALPTSRVSVAISPDGASLATIGPGASSVLIFDMDTLTLRPPALLPPGTNARAIDLAFAPDSKSLLVAADSRAVARYDVSPGAVNAGDGAPIALIRDAHDAECRAIAVDPAQRFVVTGGDDAVLRAWPLRAMRDPLLPATPPSRTPSQSFVGHRGRVNELCFASGGTRVVSVGTGAEVFVWGVDDVAVAALALAAHRDDDDAAAAAAAEEEEDAAAAFEPTRTLPTTPAPATATATAPEALPVAETSPVKKAAAIAAKPAAPKPAPPAPPPPPPPAAKPSASASPPKIVELNPKHPTDTRPVPTDSMAYAGQKIDPPKAPPPPPAAPAAAAALRKESGGAAAAASKKQSNVRRLEPASLRPSKVIGLASGVAAAAKEESENAAAVAGAAAAPQSLYLPELGAVVFAAGADVVVERVGGDRQQALLRRHPHAITALAHHPGARLIASASPASDKDVSVFDASAPGECVVCVWDAMTGTCVHELRHADAGGVVASLSFSPSGSLLLSTGADPDGAVRVWDVATGGLVAAATCDAPVAASAWLPRGAKTAFVTAGADGVKCWRVSVVEEDADESDAATSDGDDDSSDEASRKTAPPNTKYVVADPVPFPFDAASDAASVSELTSTGDPVCTALCVAENGAVYTGDSRGRVWRAAPVDDLDASSAPALALCAKALPELEAVTALACVGATGAKLFVGSSKRARVWEHAMRGKGWEEVGELELDGAVVTAAFSGGAAESSEYEPSRDCDGSDSSSSLPGKPVGIVTTSAGSAWLVDVSTGTARALAQAHPRAIASVSLSAIGSRVALATVDVDGAARVWDAESSAKVIEVFSEEKNEKKPTRASVVATSPNGGHVCLGCEDGSIGVVRVGSDSRPGGSRRRSESRSSSVSGPVKRVRAHASDSGGVVCVAFVPPALVAPKGIDLTPLLSVARDGTIAVTQTHVAEADAASFVPSSLVRVVENDRGGGREPLSENERVTCAAVERDTNPALIATASDERGLCVYAVDVVEHVARRRASYLPTFERFEPLAAGTARGATLAKKPKPGDALCAWSAASTGVAYFCAPATAGKIVAFDAARNAVTRVVDAMASKDARGPTCLGVAAAHGFDVVAVGGEDGVEFIEVPTLGAEGADSGAECASAPAKGLRRGVLRLAEGASALEWSEDGKKLWVASGNCAYEISNPAAHLR